MSKSVAALAKILSDMYKNAPRKERVTQIHFFGVKYAKEIREVGVREIVEQAGIYSTYITEITKAVNLAKYVRPI